MWHYGLWDFDGVRIGEVLNADRSATLPLRASFTIRLDNPMADEIISRKRKVLLTIYNDEATTPLQFTGQCTFAEVVSTSEGKSLQCNFTSAGHWRLQKRLCGKVASPGVSFTHAGSPNGRGQIAASLLSTTNAERDTGIREGTIATLHATAAGPWFHKPVLEAYSEMAVPKIYPYENPSTASHTHRDGFGNPVAWGNYLTGKALDDPTSQNWATVVTGAGDFWVYAYGGGGVVARGGLPENFAVAGTQNFTNFYWHCDISHAAIENNLSGIFVRGGAPDITAECLLGLVSLTPTATTIDVRKRLPPSSDVSLGTVITAAIEADTITSLRMHVLDTGQWWFWVFPYGEEPVFPTLSGTDADLATGGALASGMVGVVDAGVTTSLRSYWSVRGKVPATAMTLQGFEYELVPSEPTVDGSGVKIATLNASARLGTDRSATVIFEDGKGNRSIKESHYILDATDQLTQAYSLTDVEVRLSKDQDAIDDDGLYEEVIPNDLGDAGLRQALADAHVLVRKQAKETVTYTPTSSPAFVYGVDYFLNDTVTARIAIGDTEYLNAAVRVYEVEVSIDKEGKEEIKPVLVQE